MMTGPDKAVAGKARLLSGDGAAIGAALELGPSRSYLIAKRGLDLIISFLALLLFSPLILIVALAIRLDSPGPVLFGQERVGYDRRTGARTRFRMYKLRSMYQNNDDRSHREHVTELITNGFPPAGGGGPTHVKMRNDQRVTRVGRILRKTSIDELPQLWNVLRGDMSLVGPRPPLPYEVAVYSPHHLQRLGAVPGCTGLWQVSGWYVIGFEEMVAIDIYYIQHRSLRLDLTILLKTVLLLLGRRGG